MVEFLHSTGWVPFELWRPGSVEHWTGKCPAFKHRRRLYLPAPPKKRKARR